MIKEGTGFHHSSQNTKLTKQRTRAKDQSCLLQSFTLIKFTSLSWYNLNPKNIIFTISIRKISNIVNMRTFEQQSQSIDQQSSYSDFSFSRTKKIQRRNNRKKVTKIVHTYCFLIKTSEGKQEAFYYQRLAESALKQPEALKQLVQRQLRQNDGRIIESAKEKAGLPQISKSQKTITDELVSTPPLVHFFDPSPYYFIY